MDIKKVIQLFLFSYLLVLIVACNRDSNDLSDPNNIDLTNIPSNPIEVIPNTPEFWDEMIIPSNNRMTEEGIDLGRHLFYDPILSIDSSLSCSNCHQQAFNFANQEALIYGADGNLNKRSVLPLVNLGYEINGFFYDGRATTLEESVLMHVVEPNTLNGNWETIELRLKKSEFYREKFRKAFEINNSKEINSDLASKAVAQFLRSIVSAGSLYDQVISSENNGAQLTDEQTDGYFLFFREQNFTLHPGCSHCHDTPLFSGIDFYNNGIDSVDQLSDFIDPGRGGITGELFDYGQFKAPSLRNITETAPYMHDGRFETLEEVLDHYISGGHLADNLDLNITGFEVSDYEKEAILAYLTSLTDTDFLTNPDFSNPFDE